jgi:hypothetical protein
MRACVFVGHVVLHDSEWIGDLKARFSYLLEGSCSWLSLHPVQRATAQMTVKRRPLGHNENPD